MALSQIADLLKLGNIYNKNFTESSLQIAGIDNLNSFIAKFSNNPFHGTKALDYSD
jgi:hypothetical protein